MVHVPFMASLSALQPPKERKGPSPTLRTLHEVERILRNARDNDDGPLLLDEIRRRMKGNRASTSSVRACVDELKRLHLVTEDVKRGAMWTYHQEPPSWRGKRWVKL